MRLGDASYSIDLAQAVSLPIVFALLPASAATWPPVLVIAAALSATTLAGVAMRRWIEAPLSRDARRLADRLAASRSSLTPARAPST